ncbi:hypothetical protein [Pseudobacteriovorax antillogorgiicola]|uniref:Uncharacterized protein n=1 Tax=Pseudobacteriovorax antillogorgiicola TaxID=1513793 RepID=A0A1Y6C9B2_9BACT|nr:hypothetical protein [Pseudobacteriovorax antillogorgiicola]TCS49040.1 hypothetical protein EDD56_11683 [Pseudobacteriovorax antillogorgiicola]SMF52656.1 hypothetical protein SAMN06296036_11671 [Pseudobacteriovorax antillogorgiicola]
MVKVNFQIVLIYFVGFLLSCANSEIKESSVPYFDVFLEYEATNKQSNSLIIRASSSNFLYKLDTGDYETDGTVGGVIPVQEKTTFFYASEGEYAVDVWIYYEDGTLFAKETLSWVYDQSIPSLPTIGLSEKATSDENVLLLVSGHTGTYMEEIWIEGDLDGSDSPTGSWREIPSTGIIPIKLSPGESLKSLKVKTRNKADIESEVITLSIPLKSSPPESCRVHVASSTNSRFMRFEVEGIDSSVLQYRVYGDTNNDFQFHEFTGRAQVDLELSRGVGTKNITIQIKDVAENFCLREEKTIIYNLDYEPAAIEIDGDPIWTESQLVTVNTRLDYLPSDTVEMYLFGGIEGPNVSTWIPYQESVALTLSPSEGHRWVRAKFRVNNVEIPQVWDGVYLNPFIVLQGSSSPYTLLTSNIIELESMTITGCIETYTDIAYQEGLACTPSGTKVSVDYTLTSGELITREVDVP